MFTISLFDSIHSDPANSLTSSAGDSQQGLPENRKTPQSATGRRKTPQNAYSYEAPMCYRMFHTLVYTVTRKDDLLVKSALFDFLISTNRQL